jgi:hypothetical protein
MRDKHNPAARARRGVGSRGIGGGALGDPAHHDPARKRHGIAAYRKAFTVAVGPCGTDGCPEGGFAFTVDAVQAVGGFVDGSG